MAARKASEKRGGQSSESRKLGPGETPPVGYLNALRAQRNIEAKVCVLRAWLAYLQNGPDSFEPGIPLDSVPTTQTAFNQWQFKSLGDNVFGSFESNSNVTLKKNKKLYDEVLVLLPAIRGLAAKSSSSGRQQKVVALERRMSIAKRLREIAEGAFVNVRAELWRARKDIDLLQSAIASTENRAKEEIDELKQRIASLSAENARLTALLSKVTPLRPIS